jgi:hypothetical protein
MTHDVQKIAAKTILFQSQNWGNMNRTIRGTAVQKISQKV